MTATAPAPRGNLGLGIIMGVVVGALIVALAWFALLDPATAEPGPTPSPTETQASVEPTPSEEPSPTPTETPSESPTPEETTPAESPSPEVTEPTPTPEESTPPEGIITDLPAGSWVTVLDSLAQSGTTPEQALARAAELSHPDHQAIVIDTNAFPNLNPGYYAVVVPGQASRADSNAVCEAIGIPLGNNCYPRQITE